MSETESEVWFAVISRLPSAETDSESGDRWDSPWIGLAGVSDRNARVRRMAAGQAIRRGSESLRITVRTPSSRRGRVALLSPGERSLTPRRGVEQAERGHMRSTT